LFSAMLKTLIVSDLEFMGSVGLCVQQDKLLETQSFCNIWAVTSLLFGKSSSLQEKWDLVC